MTRPIKPYSLGRHTCGLCRFKNTFEMGEIDDCLCNTEELLYIPALSNQIIIGTTRQYLL